MSRIALSGDASGTGTFTIASPNSNSNFTLSLPTESGTLTTTASTPTFTGAVTAPAFIPNSSTVPVNGVFLPAANTVGFSTNSTERMRLDSSGRLGIGTNDPNSQVTINGGTGSGFTTVLQLSAGSTGNNNGPALTFNENYGDYAAYKTWQLGVIRSAGETTTVDYAGYIAFLTNDGANATDLSEKFRINRYGNIALKGATTNASGVGITFPATQSASSNANTLDDYEEGTWTPTIKFGGNSTGMTYTTQLGTYIKIGRTLIISMVINLSAKGSSTGDATISNLPFSVTSNARGGQVGANYSSFTNTVYGIGYYADGTTVELVANGLNGSVTMTQANFTDSSAFRMTGVYIVD